ncbi:hypothetical protein DMENIID0001_133600 [Sergentomyia squamirostris]
MLHASFLSIALAVVVVPIGLMGINVLASGSMTRDSSTRKNDDRPKFISFDTDDETIEMAVEFSVPFLQIPKSLGKFSSSLARGENPATINFGALLLLSIIAVIGTIVGSLKAPGYSSDPSGLTSLFKTDNESPPIESSNWLWTTVRDSMMMESGILNDCAQKFVCMTTAEASASRRRNGGSQLDSLIAGISQRIQMGDMKLGKSVSKAIESALNAGESGCSTTFQKCAVKINPLQHYLV